MSNTFNLNGKVALVRAVLAASARRSSAAWPRKAPKVAFTYVSATETAATLVADIHAEGGQALALRADSADAAAVQQAVQATVEAFGRLDILVNNAGVLAVAPVTEFDLAEFDRMLAINVRSVFVASQAAARHMGQGGRIINIGSTNAERMPFAGGAPYAMSKSALVGLTRGMARDLGPQGITVNNVQPGPVDTDMNPASGEFADSLIPLMAIGRYGKVEEIASFVAYLAGPEAGYITGASLTADGGFAA